MESGIHRHGIRNPQRGIRNPRLSWITLHGATHGFVHTQTEKENSEFVKPTYTAYFDILTFLCLTRETDCLKVSGILSRFSLAHLHCSLRTFMGSYIQGFLRLGVLTFRDSYVHGFLRSWVLTFRGSYV